MKSILPNTRFSHYTCKPGKLSLLLLTVFSPPMSQCSSTFPSYIAFTSPAVPAAHRLRVEPTSFRILRPVAVLEAAEPPVPGPPEPTPGYKHKRTALLFSPQRVVGEISLSRAYVESKDPTHEHRKYARPRRTGRLFSLV